ncbi:probable serine/threonine-protein kinase clkA [Vanessa cardui]|uniref:probable serine/threonine-protein kinase clkA n=1 Tax=Vanessa cardui TaxID=171605 RepID=UPI001F146485|nr:probable serine/threonine-protein kinase clkA [Vanessa cardui]
MRRVVFVFICVFIFSLHQAKTHNYGFPRYEETNSHKTYTDYISPIFVLPIRIKRQTHNTDYSDEMTVPNYSDNYYRNTDANRNQLLDNFYGSHPKRQHKPNLDNRFNNNPIQESDNTKADILIIENTKKATNNYVGKKIRNYYPQRFDNPDTIYLNTENFRRGNTDGVSIVNIGNGQGKNNIVEVYERRSGDTDVYFHNTDNTRNSRRGATITNIGNGIGNRNKIYIQDNVDILDPSDTAARRPAYRRSTNTQQTNNRHNWNKLNSNSRKKIHPSFNNGDVSRMYTRIGQGTDNTNLIYVNGVPILSNSGVTISETNHQGRGEQPYYNTKKQIYISDDKLRVLPHRRFN